MHQTNTLKEKFNVFLRIFTPMVLTQFSLLAGTFVSIFLTGQYGTIDLAGVSVAYNLWITCFMGIMGTLLGITPIVSQLLGANKTKQLPEIIHHGLYLATFFSGLLILLGILTLEPILQFLKLEPAAANVSLEYMKALSFGIFPLFWVCVLRNIVDSHGYTHYSMYIMISSFFISSFFNYSLILGHFGFPALGGVGAGYAITISCWFNFIIYTLILVCKDPFKKYAIFAKFSELQLPYLVDQLKVGIPIGISIFCEGSIFSIAGLLMTIYGTKIIAAHQAAISFTNLFYCFPLSISMAATILVAFELGGNRPKDALIYSHISRGTAIVLAILICMYSFTHMNQIAALYSTDREVQDLIISFLVYAVFFTVIDAFGTPIQGILRGYKDVKSISLIAIGSYWGTCFPIAYIFSRHFHYGPHGVWIGLLGSVFIASLLYTLRVWHIQHNKYKPQ